MAYMSFRREPEYSVSTPVTASGRGWWRSSRPVHAMLETVWAQVPGVCPVCRARARGGCLCEACRLDAVASRQAAACCPRCGLNLALILPEEKRSTKLVSDACPDCAALSPAFGKAVAAFDYSFPGDMLVRQFKQQHRFQHGRALSALMAQALAPELPEWRSQACLVAIPGATQALKRRGFNPAAELAHRLAARLGLAVRKDVLLRRNPADSERVQKRLSRRERLLATSQAFVCRVPLEGARIILVDDVMTTGATLHGAAQVLRHAGAHTVWGVVAARTPYMK